MYLFTFYISLRPMEDLERKIENFIDNISSEYKRTMRCAYVFNSVLAFSDIREKLVKLFKNVHPYGMGDFMLIDLNNIKDIGERIDGYIPEKTWDDIKKIYKK